MGVEQIQQIDPKTIGRPSQVRSAFGEVEHVEMQDSIRAVGILQPVLLRREGTELVVLDGERRIRAAVALGLSTVPAIVVDGALNPTEVIQRQLVANCVRENLSPLDQAKAIRQLMRNTNTTAAEVGRQIGRSPANVSKLLTVLTAPADVQAKIASGEIGLKAAYDASRHPGTDAPSQTTRPKKVTVKIDSQRSIGFVGIEADIDTIIQASEDLLVQLRAARKQGLTWPTVAAMPNDRAK